MKDTRRNMATQIKDHEHASEPVTQKIIDLAYRVIIEHSGECEVENLPNEMQCILDGAAAHASELLQLAAATTSGAVSNEFHDQAHAAHASEKMWTYVPAKTNPGRASCGEIKQGNKVIAWIEGEHNGKALEYAHNASLQPAHASEGKENK